MSSRRLFIRALLSLFSLAACTSGPANTPGGNEPSARPEPVERSCQPRTCEQLGARCGPSQDGCGGALECGTCPEGLTCGGEGLSNLCLARADTRSVSWLKTFQEPVLALATEPRANIVLFTRTTAGAAPTQLDPEGHVLWSRPGISWLISFSGMSVAPGTGELLAWGWREGEAGPGSSIAYGFDASGNRATLIGRCGDECTLGPYFKDAAGDLLEFHVGSVDSVIHYERPDGTGWFLSHADIGNSQTPFGLGEAVFDAQGNVLVAASLRDEGSFQGRTFGTAGQFTLVVLKLSPQGGLLWAREIPASSGRLDHLGVSSSGQVVVQGRFNGRLMWPGGEVLSSSQRGDAFLMSLDAEGRPSWIHLLPPNPYFRYLLSVSPSGTSAVVSEAVTAGAAGPFSMHTREYDAGGQLLWNHTWSPLTSPGRVLPTGVAWSGEDVVLGGQFNGAVDFGTGVQQGPVDAYDTRGFVLKLHRP